MKTTLSASLFILLSILFSGGMPLKQYRLSKELDELRKHKISYKFLDSQTIELDQAWSGFHRVKTLREPDEAKIRAYAQAHDIPVLEIDPSTIDTSKYTGWYTYWKSIPLSNGFGYPLMVGDLDHNGKAEVYGCYDQYDVVYQSRIYEIDHSGNVKLRYTYRPYRGGADQLLDVDKNGLMEVMYQLGDTSYFFEQPSLDSLPVRKKFQFARFESCTAYGEHDLVADLDADSLSDLLFLGSPAETICTKYQTYVAEYDSQISNFHKVWSYPLGLSGYDVGDYDGNGKMNFIGLGMMGQIWVFENTGTDSYAVSWYDSIPFVNLYYLTSGDVDHDGKREFFVGATMSDGNWTMVFEADSNNHYSPTFLFHLLSGGSLDEPTYMTADVDGDGIPELVIMSGAELYFFKSDGDNSYYLWYDKHNNAKQSVQFYDFDGDGRKDFIISKDTTVNEYALNLYAEIFRADKVTGVSVKPGQEIPQGFRLCQNYPNPFNPSTRINYQVPTRSHVTITIYDLLGRAVEVLVDAEKEPGNYSAVWNAKVFQSGVYFCKMQTERYTDMKKLALIK